MERNASQIALKVLRVVLEVLAGLGIVLSFFNNLGKYVAFLDNAGMSLLQIIVDYVPYPGLFLISFPVFVALITPRYITFLLRPKLKLVLAEIREERDGPSPAFHVRVVAKNRSRRTAVNCAALLKQVDRLGADGPREYSLPLEWTDIGAKTTIAPGLTERFDVVKAIKDANKFTHCSPRRPIHFIEDMPPGDYVFTVMAKSDGKMSEPFKFGIKWEGRWNGLKLFEP